MSKYPLEWHRSGIRSLEASLAARAKQLERLQEEYKRSSEQLEFCKRQLSEAKKRGILAYDPERFLMTKRKEV